MSFRKKILTLSSDDVNKGNVNYNLTAFITKKRIINVKCTLVKLQNYLRSFIYVKKARKDGFVAIGVKPPVNGVLVIIEKCFNFAS